MRTAKIPFALRLAVEKRIFLIAVISLTLTQNSRIRKRLPASAIYLCEPQRDEKNRSYCSRRKSQQWKDFAL